MIEIAHPYQNHYMKEAFEGFVVWASKSDEMKEAFLSGHPEIIFPSSGIERMIDKATDNDKRISQLFIDWCVVQFGLPDEIEEAE